MKTRWILSLISLLLILPAQSIAKDKYETLKRIIEYEKLDELQVEMDIGVAELIVGKSGGDNLLEANIHYQTRRGEPVIRFKKSGGIGYLTIESADKDEDYNEHHLKKKKDKWELRFSPKVKIAFNMELGLVDGDLDMTGLQVTDLDFSGGLSDIDLTFDEPNRAVIDDMRLEVGLGSLKCFNLGNANFRNFKLESGLGSARLDLAGNWRLPETDMDLEVGLGSAKVEIPENLGVEVYARDSFLGSVNLDRELRETHEDVYRTSNWDDADHRISITADVGLGSIKVKIVD